MRLVISFAFVLVAIAMADALEEKKYYDVSNAKSLFKDFVNEHQKQYKDDADTEAHYQAFVRNLEKINELNKKNPSATYGINKFADYTEEEKSQMFGFRKPQN